ncbi:MAG TPA: glycosyltransferase [Ramlibacter sp.]|jgi:hypothetical protein|nr:glycosyltransferase [Ramlibacter sp.]
MKYSQSGHPEDAVDYDAVLMLTWSDWHREPRSNRYHYGSRFARDVPVLFLQPVLPPGAPAQVEASGVPGLDLVSLPQQIESTHVAQVLALLRERGVRRPLLWIYSCFHYAPILDALPQALRVYHATEDYFTPAKHWDNQDYVAGRARALLKDVDLVVGVSARVNQAYAELGGYQGPTYLAPNGCDAPFFLDIAAKAPPAREKVAIFQGGINARLDFALLFELAGRMKDWTFWFVGKADERVRGWKKLQRRPNVEYLGPMGPEEFTKKMCEATVGIIPFTQVSGIWNSLPLKAYEYVACGLPVVTIPIHALMDQPQLFRSEISAEGFARAIRELAPSRTDPAALARRREAALLNSYDSRFEGVRAEIRKVVQRKRKQRKRLNVCVLYDQGSNRVNTIREHLESFGTYSRHQVVYMPATDVWLQGFSVSAGGDPHDVAEPDFSFFDAVIVHYSVRVNVDGHMTAPVERALQRFPGLKVLFLQDEYETPEPARRWMERVHVDIVYTCVPPESVHKLYPRERFPWVDFRQTLTGYVPEDASLDDYVVPLAQRPWLIGYRGRKLPAIYGVLGWEKYVIGREVRRLADQRGLKVDVEVDDKKRIYGKGWYQFLGSARSTLGTESGCNLFDFEGKAAAIIRARRDQDPEADYWSMREELEPFERDILMNQVSPKIFESIRMRTALVLFEGAYSGVVQAHEHYIPLKKDFSNFDEVVAFLKDDAKVQALTDRSYRDIVESGRYSYATFVGGIDTDMERALVRGPRVRLFTFPLLALTPDDRVEQLGVERAAGALLASGVVERDGVREALLQHAERITRQIVVTAQANGSDMVMPPPPPSRSTARKVWRMLPAPVRVRLGGGLRSLVQRHRMPEQEKSATDRLISACFRLVPGAAKRAASRFI